MSMETIILGEARIIMLKALQKEVNQSITSEAMRRYLLTSWLIDKPREWVEQQFLYLKDMGAVDIHPGGSTKIARLTERGALHLEGLITIPGVQPASLSGA